MHGAIGPIALLIERRCFHNAFMTEVFFENVTALRDQYYFLLQNVVLVVFFGALVSSNVHGAIGPIVLLFPRCCLHNAFSTEVFSKCARRCGTNSTFDPKMLFSLCFLRRGFPEMFTAL